MGNQLTQPSRLVAAEAIADLGSVTFKDNLGGGRFFKSALCVHDDGGLVVVKVYAKRDDSPDLRPYRERLLAMGAALASVEHPHAWPVQRVYESERAAFLLRQYMHANLAQRITTRPFLTLVEKRWIAYQLLLALVQCHERGVCHGDIRAENVALTSWDWAFLVDFAPYKPTLLPADNPADFSFFFDTGGRRKCCLAPERFYDPAAAGITPQQEADAPLTPAMDVFALGCVLAELFMDGQPLFDYSRLLAYRQGSTASDALAPLSKVHPSVRGMVAHMLQRDPAARHSAAQYLQDAAAAALPPWLAATVHPLHAAMLLLDADARVALAARRYPDVKAQLLGSQGGDAGTAGAGMAPADPAPQQPASEQAGLPAGDSRSGQSRARGAGVLLPDAQAALRRLEGRGSSGSTPPITPRLTSSTAEHERQPGPAAQQAGRPPDGGGQGSGAQPPPPAQHEGMVLVAVLLCSLLRGSRLQGHKARLVGLLSDAAAHCDDDTRLQRLLPYLVAATAEPLAAVKAVALRGVVRVLEQVRTAPASEAQVFGEYVLPALSLLPSEAELAVQVEYAACVARLAATARAFLEQLQRQGLRGGGSASSADGAASTPPLNFDEEMSHLRAGVERVLHDLLVAPHPETRLALLPHAARLAAFLGRRDTADVLLPSLITFFNSSSWQVRAALYACLEGVCPWLGPEGVARIVAPFLDRMVGDPQPAVAAQAAAFLAGAARRGLLRKRHLLDVAARLCARQALGPGAPAAVRAAAVQFLAAAAAQLPQAAVHAQLLPLVLPHLASEPLDLQDPEQIARVLKSGGRADAASLLAQRSRPAVLPMRPGHPPLPPAAACNAQRSPDLPGAAPGGQLPAPAGVSRSVMVGGSACAAGSPAGSRSLLLPPPSASTYSLQVDPRFLRNASSHLSAALQQSGMAAGGGGAARQRASPSQVWGPAEGGQQLVARARRSVPQPASIAQHLRVPHAAQSTGSAWGAPQSAGGAGGSHGVRDAMSAALSAGMPGGGGARGAACHAPWYPRGVLVAHLAEHRRAVTRLAAAPASPFLASASADGSVKVWDCRRLDRDVSFRSRLTYAAHGQRVEALAASSDGHTVASGCAAGAIHVWRVEVAARAGGAPERYTGIVGCSQLPAESGGVLDLAWLSPSLLASSSQRGGVAGWDTRATRPAWSLPAPHARGVVQRFAAEPGGATWLLGGTSRGALSLWDLRFLLPLATWQHPAAEPIQSLALALAPAERLGLAGGAGPLAYVAAGEGEVGLWDVAEAKCRQVLRVLRPGSGDAAKRSMPAALSPPAAALLPPRAGDMMGRARQLAISELQAPQAGRGCVRALLPTEGGQLLAGGSDRVVRCWDSGRPQQSYVVCAPPPPIPPAQTAAQAAADAAADAASAGGAPVLAGAEGSQVTVVDVPQYSYAWRSVQGVPVVEESCALRRSSSAASASGADREQHLARMSWSERASALCHQLPVTDLVRVEASEALLLSASADGVIKAWR